MEGNYSNQEKFEFLMVYFFIELVNYKIYNFLFCELINFIIVLIYLI